jgi:hypothetical protein
VQVYQPGVVYDGFRFDTRQDPKDMKKAIPSLSPFLALFMGYESAAAQEMPPRTICIGTGFHVLPDSRALPANRWHKGLQKIPHINSLLLCIDTTPIQAHKSKHHSATTRIPEQVCSNASHLELSLLFKRSDESIKRADRCLCTLWG